jgi:hypothetical protein
MRKYEKKINLNRVNVLNEQRYLNQKGYISENEIDEDWKTNIAAGLAMAAGGTAKAQNPSPNQSTPSKEISTNQGLSQDDNVANPFNIQTKANSNLKIKLSSTFKSGASSVNPNDAEVKNFLKQLTDFVQKNEGALIRINITGSESQVPNQENLKAGSIANARANSVKQLLSNINGDLEIKTNTKIGDTKWDESLGKDNQKYVSEQYVIIEAKAFQTSCSITTTVRNKGITNTLSSDVTGKIFNLLEPGNIPDRMTLRDASGKLIVDTGFFADGSHKYGSSVKLVPQFILALSKLKQSNDVSMKELNPNLIVHVNNFNELLNLMFDGFDYKTVMENNSTDIGKALNQLKPMYANGGDVVIYKVIPSNKLSIKYDLTGTEGRLDVYSPLKTTDFKITSPLCK